MNTAQNLNTYTVIGHCWDIFLCPLSMPAITLHATGVALTILGISVGTPYSRLGKNYSKEKINQKTCITLVHICLRATIVTHF
jgi:hypothetical protein